MLQIIKGQVSLIQYFICMLISTICLVSVVAAAFILPHDKNIVAILMMILSIVSIGSSAMVMNLTLHKKDY